MSRRRGRAALRGVALVAAYSSVVSWLTWPLASSISSVMPATGMACYFDLYYSAWALAHESHALAVGGAHFADGNIYFPATNALFYGPAALGALPLFGPVFLATGNPALAVNVLLILGLSLTGVAMHGVVWRWTGSDLAAVVGALSVLCNQWLMWDFVPTAPHWAALYCLPLIAFVAATRLDSLRGALCLVPLIALQCLTDLVYLTPAVLGPLGVLAALRLLRGRTRAAGLRLIGSVAVAVVLLLPVLYVYRSVQAANPNLAKQTSWGTTEASFPSVLPQRFLAGPVPLIVTPVAMGLTVIGIAAAIWRRRTGSAPPLPGGWAHAVLWTLVGGYLSLTPLVVIGGRPFHSPLTPVLEMVPALQAIRVPSRLGIAGLMGLGLLSGVAFGEIAALLRERLRRAAVAHGAAALLAAIAVALSYRAYAAYHWTYSGPEPMPPAYPVQSAPGVPAAFLPVLRESRTPILELPVGFMGDQSVHALAMFHSITHGRPVLNGYSSYWPEDFPGRMATAQRLPDRDALDELVETTGLALVWIHNNQMTAAQQTAWAAAPRPEDGRRGFVVVAQEGWDWLLAVSPAPAAD